MRWRDAARDMYRANIHEYEDAFGHQTAPPFQYGPDYLLVRYQLWQNRDLRRAFRFPLLDNAEREILDKQYGVLDPERRAGHRHWVRQVLAGRPPPEVELQLLPNVRRSRERALTSRAERSIADRALYKLAGFYKGERAGMAPWQYDLNRARFYERAGIISDLQRGILEAYFTAPSKAAMNSLLGNHEPAEIKRTIRSFFDLTSG